MRSIPASFKQLFYCAFCSMLIATIAVCCLQLNSFRSVNGYSYKSRTSYQFNMFTAHKNACVLLIGSASATIPYNNDLVLKQVIDGQVYTPDKRKGKASNIKKNLSLARLRIVTA